MLNIYSIMLINFEYFKNFLAVFEKYATGL